MMVPDSCLTIDRWLRVYFSLVKTEALHGVFYLEAPDLEFELAPGNQRIKYSLELLLASNLCTSFRQQSTANA